MSYEEWFGYWGWPGRAGAIGRGANEGAACFFLSERVASTAQRETIRRAIGTYLDHEWRTLCQHRNGGAINGAPSDQRCPECEVLVPMVEQLLLLAGQKGGK